MQKPFKEFDELKVYLSMQKCQNEDNNLYNHISEIMNHIIIHCPDEALNKIEEISFLLKNSDQFTIQEFLLTNKIKNYSQPSDSSTLAST